MKLSRALNHIIRGLLASALISSSLSFATVIDFESLSDAEIIGDQIESLTFSNAVALSAGISLNEFDFPPVSGNIVASDFGGNLTIDFADPVSVFSAYFTYSTQLTLTAFDENLTQLDLLSSAFSSNLATSGYVGSLPNELLGFSAAGGIRRVVIAGLADGGSFVLDDLTFEPRGVEPLPAPGGLMLWGLGQAAWWTARPRKQV